MKNIPAWIIKALKKETVKCHYCKEIFGDRSITAVGIRKGQDLENKEFLFVELFCKKCNKTTLFELTEMYLEELACEILGIDENLDIEELSDILETEVENYISKEQEQEKEKEKDKPTLKKSKKKVSALKSKITAKEIKEGIEFLNSINSHDDFLVELGMTPEDIDKYKERDKDNE